MSRQMLNFSEVDWAGVIGSSKNPVTFCLEKKISIYFMVDRERQRVRYTHRIQLGLCNFVYRKTDDVSLYESILKAWHRPSLCEFFVEGFHDAILFLGLKNSSLAEIAISGRSIVSSFDRGGLSVPQPFHVKAYGPHGHAIREYEDIDHPTLERIEFDRAFLVDKERWEFSSSRGLSDESMPEDFVMSAKVGEGDLWVASDDIQSLVHDSLIERKRDQCPYPFAHKKEMPGVYWMYQAAYAHNKLNSITNKKSSVGRLMDVGHWLLVANRGAFPSRSIRSAKKFVPPYSSRKKGKSRREFLLDILIPVGEEESRLLEAYAPDFVGPGLSCILSVADWWWRYYYGPSEDRLKLAIKLDAFGFEGLELGDLVHIISGKPLSSKEVLAFEAYLIEQGRDHKPFDFVDKEKRPKPSSAKG